MLSLVAVTLSVISIIGIDMIGRITLLAFIAASGSVHLLPILPDHVLLRACWIGIPLAAFGLYCWNRQQTIGVWVLPVLAALTGFTLTVIRAEARLADTLATSNVNLVSRAEVRVVSLPRQSTGMQTFDAEVLRSVPDGVPTRIRVSWRSGRWQGPYARDDDFTHDGPHVIPGQIWRMALIMKPPYGSRNPNGFDYEGYLFAQGVRAMATVRGEPVLLADEPWYSLTTMAERARYIVRERMRPYLQEQRYGAVLLALAIGDQAGVPAEDWDVFNRTSITHLVSISGTHVTMVSGLVAIVVAALWRRGRLGRLKFAERVPAQIAGGLMALFVAWLYCLLAGWGVPAQRTFLMLAVIVSSYVLRLSVSSSQLLTLAAFMVVLLDPWAMMSSGFWLSFGAVAVLMAMSGITGQAAIEQAPTIWRRWHTVLCEATRVQLLISAALIPVLALLFNQVSIVSPLANAYAIPVISVLVTPLSLLAALFSVVPGADALASVVTSVAHVVLQWMMVPTTWLASQAAASISVASVPLALTLLALVGLGVVFLPRGIPGTMAGWALFLPALTWLPARPSYGDWDAVALDVGQAAAIVIKTSEHNILFDTGLRHSATVDSATRVIWPYLQSMGITHLDAMVVSHADIDHVGGLRSLLDLVSIEQSYSSFNVDAWLRREASMLGTDDAATRPTSMTPCHRGQRWEVDGVAFAVLWPPSNEYSSLHSSSRDRNDRSCVLQIQGQHHSLLLTGDISAAQEYELVSRGLEDHHVVLAAHHGSNGSSSPSFIDTTRAAHVIMQAGAWSRYGHPHPATVRRWQNAGTQVWRTDHHGAIIMQSRETGLYLQGERQRRPRYWQQVW